MSNRRFPFSGSGSGERLKFYPNMKAIIAEKPSVGMDIARVVGATDKKDGYCTGNGYMVTWALGHLVSLAMPGAYGYTKTSAENLPMLPDPFRLVSRQVRTDKGMVTDIAAAKQLKIIDSVFDRCDSIIVATDCAREGELIFRWIYSYLGYTKPFKRLWISSLTDEAIREGLANLRDGSDYDSLYAAADCRAKADWLVGMNASRALAVASGSANNSIGRVQTPTLAMVCARFKENRNFVSTPYWQLHLTLKRQDAHRMLIVEDNVGLSQIQKDWLSRAGYDAVTAMSEPIARSLIRKTQFDLILSDVRLPEGDGISLLEWLRKEKKDIPFIITTEFVSVPDVVRTIKLGARDYLPKPVHREHLLELAEDVFHPVATVRKQERQLFRRISPMILKVEKFARLVAPSDMSVMILGANGTGKESVAQTIHDNSERYGKPFVAVNCGALPRELAASLFFGHEKGAFTGADTAKTGYFDLAKGGTLFLDEIGTMPHEIQSMLLRVLQENVYTPIGSGRERISDVRVISATNENMEQAIKEGRFREDLYHRLNEFEIRQPSLEECPEDIIPLAEFFRERFSKELKRTTQGFTEETKQRMLAYRWPGNVRELRNRVKRAVLVSESPMLDVDGLEITVCVCRNEETDTLAILPLKGEAFEKESIIRALKACNGHREQAAGMLNINPATLYRKMKKYGLK